MITRLDSLTAKATITSKTHANSCGHDSDAWRWGSHRRKMGETAAIMDLTTSKVKGTLSTTLSSRLVLKCWRRGDELADLCYTWSRPQRQRGYDPTLTSSSTSSWGRAPTPGISTTSTQDLAHPFITTSRDSLYRWLGQGLAKDYSNGAMNGVPYSLRFYPVKVEYGCRIARSSRGRAMGRYMR